MGARCRSRSRRAWPELNKLTYTKQEKNPPNFVLDGYLNDGLQAAHGTWKKGLETEGFTILSDKLGDRASEISWESDTSSGRVVIHQAFCSSHRVWIITNRTADYA